tara:strand:+ start:232 stop:642 length:411 start_codon:yes stop_codon:yes gene_type:complete
MSEQKTPVSEYSPLELITYLFSHLQLADNQIDWEEKEVWAESLTKFFPDHTPERAQEIFQRACQFIISMNDFERKNHLITICDQLKKHFSKNHLQNNLSPKLTKLIDADGIILSTETEMVSLIEEKLDIKIDIPDE